MRVCVNLRFVDTCKLYWGYTIVKSFILLIYKKALPFIDVDFTFKLREADTYCATCRLATNTVQMER